MANTIDKELYFDVQMLHTGDHLLTYEVDGFNNDSDVKLIFDNMVALTFSISEVLLQYNYKVNLFLTTEATFETAEGEITELLTRSSHEQFNLYRDVDSRLNRIRLAFKQQLDPASYYNDINGESNYGISIMNTLDLVQIQFTIPFIHNPRSLPQNLRLFPGLECSKFVSYVRNNDKYCLLHTIYHMMNKMKLTKNQLNNDEDYMEGFDNWSQPYLKYYDKETGDFNLENISNLEKDMDININLFMLEDGQPTIYYRSDYKSNAEIYNLIIIDTANFVDYRKTTDAKVVDTMNKVSYNVKMPFLGRTSLKRYLDNRYTHVCYFNTNYFLPRYKTSGNLNPRYACCMYCNAVVTEGKIEEHEEKCAIFMSGEKDKFKRLMNFQDMKNPVKKFDRQQALLKTSFCTYDFETRIIDGMHKPFSYILFYFNKFYLEKSVIILRDITQFDNDEEILLQAFNTDVKYLAKYHYDQQTVDFYDPGEKALAKIPEDGVCPACCKNIDEENSHKKKEESKLTWHFNHSHFVSNNDTNRNWQRYICSNCNCRMQLRGDKCALKFYAHNQNRYDMNLILKSILKDTEFHRFEPLAKSADRFQQLVFTYDEQYKVSFNDSLLLIGKPLASVTQNYINPGKDKDIIKIFLDIYYKKKYNAELVEHSLVKAPFPYDALNKPELYQVTEPLPREEFYNSLTGKDISDKDYESYLSSQNIIGGAFLDYHNFYLLLDGILLAIALDNYAEQCYNLSGVWCMHYLSTSSFSMAGLLRYNQLNKLPEFHIPKHEQQVYINKSLHGGTTFSFEKYVQAKEGRLIAGCDANSLYPTCMSLNKLPYKFKETLTNVPFSEIKRKAKDHYIFLTVNIKAVTDKELQKKLKIYPFFPENIIIKPDMISKEQHRRFSKGHEGEEFISQEVNTFTFYAKKDYVVEYKYLEFALSLGYELADENISRADVYYQDFCMKGYIDKMYDIKKDVAMQIKDLNQEIKNGKDLYAEVSNLETKKECTKVILNGLYGAQLVNQERHSEAEIHRLKDDKSSAHFQRSISTTRFKSLMAVDENIAIVNSMKVKYQHCYLRQIGSAILWESKLIVLKLVYKLYDFASKYGMTLNSIYSDTDSYYYYLDNFCFKDEDDFRDSFNKEYGKIFDQDESGDMGYFSDEIGMEYSVEEFVSVAPKSYSIKLKEKSTGKLKTKVKAKGISRDIAAQMLNFELYKSIATNDIFKDFENQELTAAFKQIKASKLQIKTIECRKKIAPLVDMKTFNRVSSKGVHIYKIFGE